MRKNIVAGNWKMNTTVPEGVELAKAVVEKSAQVPESVGLIIATPFTHLVPVADVVKGSKVELLQKTALTRRKAPTQVKFQLQCSLQLVANILSSATLREDSTTVRQTLLL